MCAMRVKRYFMFLPTGNTCTNHFTAPSKWFNVHHSKYPWLKNVFRKSNANIFEIWFPSTQDVTHSSYFKILEKWHKNPLSHCKSGQHYYFSQKMRNVLKLMQKQISDFVFFSFYKVLISSLLDWSDFSTKNINEKLSFAPIAFKPWPA